MSNWLKSAVLGLRESSIQFKTGPIISKSSTNIDFVEVSNPIFKHHPESALIEGQFLLQRFEVLPSLVFNAE